MLKRCVAAVNPALKPSRRYSARTQMTEGTDKLIAKVRAIIPPLSPSFHKGQAGRTVIVGGSENYTGAPYYACLSSMLLGADMGHIISSAPAGPILKSLSPDLIVYPDLHESASPDHPSPDSIMDRILPLFERMHAVVIGPGLGRDKLMIELVTRILHHLRTNTTLPVVVDADGLFLVTHNLDLIKGWKNVVLTPNVVEFKRLREAAGMKEGGEATEECASLARELGGITILQKGEHDIISNGSDSYTVTIQGGLKRCGGQGDLLSGSISTFLAWWFSSPYNVPRRGKEIHDSEGILLGCVGGSLVTRTASRLAFADKGRGMMSTDVLAAIPRSYTDLFEDKGNSKL